MACFYSFMSFKVIPLKNELQSRPPEYIKFLSFPDPSVHRDCLVEVAADLHVAARICGSYCKLVDLARTTPSHPR